MKADNILNAISNIDPRYIDEAAYELHGNPVAKIVVINKKQRIRRMIFIALPSVAAILLIISVALPAILRIGKSEAASAPSYDAAAEAPSAAAEAPSAAAEEAPSAAAEEPDAAEEAMYEAEPEAPAVEASGESAAEEVDETADASKRSEYSLNADTVIPELPAQFDNGILTIELDKIKIPDISELSFTISRIDTPAHDGVIAEGPLSDLTDQTKITGDELILDLSDISLDPGDHRIDLGLFTAGFTVPEGQ